MSDAKIGADQTLSAEEGIAAAQEIAADASGPQWRWMGNYGSVYDVVNVANSVGCGPGALITQTLDNGLLPSYMYY